MRLRDALEQDARKFLERIDPIRNEVNAKAFKTSIASVSSVTTVLAPQAATPSAPVNEETLFSPNSNGQGV